MKVKTQVKHYATKISKFSKKGTFNGAKFNSVNLIIFTIIFAVIGGYLLLQSRAAGTSCLPSDNCFPKPQGSSLPGATGIPPGTSLTNCGGDVTLSTNGQTVTGCNYTGKVTVTGNNVIIRNSRIPGGVTNSASNLLIEDSDIGPATCGQFGDIVAVVKWTDYTLRRSYIHTNSDGLRIGGGANNVHIEDNFVITCVDPGDPGAHMDGIQSENLNNLSESDITVSHNTIDNRPCAGSGCNSAVFFADLARLGTVTDNLLLAPSGSFALKIHDDHNPDIGPWVITGNRLVGGWSSANTNCTTTTWSNNRQVTIDSSYNVLTIGDYANCDGSTSPGDTNPTPPPPPPPPDPTPPTISLTAPNSGSTVSGSSVTLSANASDSVGVVGVQFKVDGNNVSSEDLSSPYSISWDSVTVSNGTHAITAVARDAAGNSTTSSSVSVTVSNASAPPGTLLLGNQTIQASSDTNASGSVEGFKYTAVATGTAGTLSFYVNSGNAATNLKVGIYSDNGGHPGTLLASGSITGPTAGAWATANLSPSINISSGTIYWIGFLGTGGTLAYKDASTGSCSESYVASGQAVLPTTWSSGQTWPSCTLSAYILATTQTPKPGDINNDNSVNLTDLSLLLSSYGQSTTLCITNNTYTCDINTTGVSNGKVDIFDLSMLLSGYGK